MMKKLLLFLLLSTLAFTAQAQYVYNPAQWYVVNKPIGVNGFQMDARSEYYDATVGLFRPYQNTAEVLTALPTMTSRKGFFPIIINTGGTLVSGVITGGTNIEYWFQPPYSNSNLVVKVGNYQTKFMVNVADLGAIGNGVFDNTAIINNAISSVGSFGEVFIPAGSYYMSGGVIINPAGIKLSGPGVIFTHTTQTGDKMLNPTPDLYQHVFGLEYLAPFVKAIMAGTSVKILRSGDSTTYGDTTTPGHTTSQISDRMIIERGIDGVVNINNGHSGNTTVQWRDTWVAQDKVILAANPGSLYVMRWGINDPTIPGRTPAQVLATVDSIIAAIRADSRFTVDKQPLLLENCSSTTGDTTYHHRSAAFYEALDRGYRIIARKYKCAYWDIYGTYQDAYSRSGNLTNDLPPDVYIHPADNFNERIVSDEFNLIFPQSLTHFTHNSSETKLYSDLPSTYSNGISQHFVTATTSGFPVTGNLTSFTQKLASVTTQILSTYDNSTTPKLYFRGGFAPAWTPWTRLVDSLMLQQTETLQAVTNRGSTTTNPIIINNFLGVKNKLYLYDQIVTTDFWEFNPTGAGLALNYYTSGSPSTKLAYNSSTGNWEFLAGITARGNQPKTNTSVSTIVTQYASNDTTNPFGLVMFYQGSATATARTFFLQTGNIGVDNQGILKIQANGGGIQLGGSSGTATLSPQDIEITDMTKGIILHDRSNGNRYRIYFSGGVMSSEIVP